MAKQKKRTLKYLIKESWGGGFQTDKWLERWGLGTSIKGNGHADLLVDGNKPFQLKYIYTTEIVQSSVIMGSGMKKEFLSLFEINECNVLLSVIFDKE